MVIKTWAYLLFLPIVKDLEAQTNRCLIDNMHIKFSLFEK